MKAAFFELESWEIPYIEERMKSMLGIDGCMMKEEKLEDAHIPSLQDTEILSVFIYSRVTREMMEKIPSLRLIVTRSTGYDHIDTAAAWEKGIKVANVPSYGENTVAEHAFALLLALSRRVYPAVARTKDFNFSTVGLRGWDLKGKTIGIVGLGHIGRHVARMAQGFEMKILGFDPSADHEAMQAQGIESVPFERLLAESDVLTLHCPYTKTTHHFLNDSAFSKLKDGVYIINTARGGLIDTQALVQALESKKVAGAGLDVLEEECEVKEERQLASKHWNDPKCDLKTMLANHALAGRDDVIITPHNAWNSREAIERILATTVENIKGYLAQAPVNIVNEDII